MESEADDASIASHTRAKTACCSAFSSSFAFGTKVSVPCGSRATVSDSIARIPFFASALIVCGATEHFSAMSLTSIGIFAARSITITSAWFGARLRIASVSSSEISRASRATSRFLCPTSALRITPGNTLRSAASSGQQ